MSRRTSLPAAERPPLARSLRLSIGGTGFKIDWDEPRRIELSLKHYGAFLHDGGDSIEMRVRTGEAPPAPSGKLLFDATPHWRLFEGPRLVFEAFDPLTRTPNMTAFIDPDFRRAEVFASGLPPRALVPPSASPRPGWSLPRLMSPLGQWLLASRLAEIDGVIMHAAAIDDNGVGRVFVGPSGAGKSTSAGLWLGRRGVRVLGDERVILRRESGRFYAYGTPWPGMGQAVSRGPVEIRQVFVIEHHPEHRAWEEPPSVLAAEIFSQIFLPRWDPGRVGSALDFCSDLVRNVACRRLGFAKNPGVVDFVRQEK